MTTAFVDKEVTRPLPRVAAMVMAAVMLAAGIVFGVAAPSHAATLTETVDGITYVAEDVYFTATATDYDMGYGTVVNIPGTVTLSDGKTYTVDTIGDRAFSLKKLTSVTIPDSVTTLEYYAFQFNKLTSVTIPNSVTEIYAGAFRGNLLTSVKMPDSLYGIGNYTFSSNLLESVTIPESVTVIGAWAFNNNLLTSVTIPDSVTTVMGSAFEENRLTSVRIPESVTHINFSAFKNNLLTSVTIPDSVTTIGREAFNNNLLTSVTIPNSVTTIDSHAFFRNALTSVTIPESVTSISQGAFSRNVLTSVTIPGSVETIGIEAFKDNLLASVTIPESVTSISQGAFSRNVLTSVTIPGSVKTIDVEAFAENTELESVMFEGAAPSTFTPGVSGSSQGSLGIPNQGKVVDYWKRFKSSGFTSPVWQGYRAQALVPVTFDSNGGSVVDPVRVKDGDTLAVPTAPTRAGYTFTGWFTDQAATAGNEYDFAAVVSDDLTLYAGWVLEAVSPATYSITYDSNGGSVVDPVRVKDGDTLAVPTAPTRAGYTFTGWFTDQAATAGNEYDFAAVVSDDLTLYAGWVLEAVSPATYSITYDSNGGSVVDPVRVKDGDTLAVPTAPTRAGYTFTGWFTDQAATAGNEYDFAAVVSDDLTLYAGWKSASRATGTKEPNTETLSTTGAELDLWGLVGAVLVLAGGALVFVRRKSLRSVKA